MDELAERIAERIRREGPIPFDAFVDAALYGEPAGSSPAAAARAAPGGDFVTSPEVGPLFGALVARALDGSWSELSAGPTRSWSSTPAPGAGAWRRDVLRAEPDCARALRYVLVERSAALRAAQRELLTLEPADRAFGPAEPIEGDASRGGAPPGRGRRARSSPRSPSSPRLQSSRASSWPTSCSTTCRSGSSSAPVTRGEVRVGLGDGRLRRGRSCPPPPRSRPLPTRSRPASPFRPDARLPVPTATADWLAECGRALRRGCLVVVDYAADRRVARDAPSGRVASHVPRARTRARHHSPRPATQDITCTIPVEHLVAHARRAGFRLVEHIRQADWLGALGIDELVEEARASGSERAAIGDLEAHRRPQPVSEAAALTDPAGLGAHRVFCVSPSGVR